MFPFGGQRTHGIHLNSRWGSSQTDATVEQMRKALAELDVEDDEHPDVSLTHESEWSLSAFGGGLLIWENLEEGDPRHLKDVSRATVLELWLALSRGEIATVEGQPWQPGYGRAEQ